MFGVNVWINSEFINLNFEFINLGHPYDVQVMKRIHWVLLRCKGIFGSHTSCACSALPCSCPWSYQIHSMLIQISNSLNDSIITFCSLWDFSEVGLGCDVFLLSWLKPISECGALSVVLLIKVPYFALALVVVLGSRWVSMAPYVFPFPFTPPSFSPRRLL